MKRFYESYKKEFNSEPTSILEIGSRDGDSAEELRELANIDSKSVYIVEPHPLCFKNIMYKYPEVHTYPFAISDEIRAIDFNAIPHKFGKDTVGTSSLLKKNKEIYTQLSGLTETVFDQQVNPENWIKILTVTGEILLELINKSEIDMVKIDVEGLTYEVLDSFGPSIKKLKMLHVEVEKVEIWKNQNLYEDVKKLLTGYNFEELYYLPMFWGGNQGDSVWIRR